MNGQTSRKQARGTMGRIMSVCMLAVLTTACGAQQTREKPETFIGDWGGTNEYGWRMEARIESIDGYRWSGVVCMKTSEGVINGARVDNDRGRVSGRMLTIGFGTNEFTAFLRDSQTLTLLEKRRRGEQRWKTETAMGRAATLACADRFTAEPTAIIPAIAERTHGIVGYWTGTWPNGNVMELAVTNITLTGQVDGHRCLRDQHLATIRVSDFGADGLLEATYDRASKEMITQSQPNQTLRQRYVYALQDDDTLLMTATFDIGTEMEGVETVEMRRGVDRKGCAAWIRTKGAEQTRSAPTRG